MTEAALIAALDVSRETTERLREYEAILRKWNARINLVSRSTLEAIWTRHFLDSAQIYRLAPRNARHWADLGSGGGFPGLIVAILAKGEGRRIDVTLVESDQRKAAFLAAAVRELGLAAHVRAERLESTVPLACDVLSARALAPLDALVSYADRHLSSAGTALFPKGANHRAELAQAAKGWRFSCESVVSLTDPEAVILKLTEIARV